MITDKWGFAYVREGTANTNCMVSRKVEILDVELVQTYVTTGEPGRCDAIEKMLPVADNYLVSPTLY